MSAAEMIAVAEYQIQHPDWLAYDGFNFIADDADFSPVRIEDLDGVISQYRPLFEPSKLLIFRRSAWLSLNPSAQAQLDHWIARRNTRREQTLEARQFDTIAEAAAWLTLPTDEASILETGEGFEELARYDLP